MFIRVKEIIPTEEELDRVIASGLAPGVRAAYRNGCSYTTATDAIYVAENAVGEILGVAHTHGYNRADGARIEDVYIVAPLALVRQAFEDRLAQRRRDQVVALRPIVGLTTVVVPATKKGL